MMMTGRNGGRTVGLAAIALAAVLLGPSAQASLLPNTEADQTTRCVGEKGPTQLWPPSYQLVNAADSVAFATAWLPAFAHLAAAIPPLSPRQEHWLEEEMRATNTERYIQAMVSREKSLQEARWNAVALETLMRSIIVEKDNAVLVRRWLQVIRVLEERGNAGLAQLVTDKIIPRAALPQAWMPATDDLLQISIAAAPILLISDIIVCTLPSLGIGDTWTMPPLPIPTLTGP